jgi:hypothetical protein
MRNLIITAMLTVVIVPRYYDITPNDGITDAGSYGNPYEIERGGRTIGTIQPRFHDITPDDGLMDAGSYSNPYELELE